MKLKVISQTNIHLPKYAKHLNILLGRNGLKYCCGKWGGLEVKNVEILLFSQRV